MQSIHRSRIAVAIVASIAFVAQGRAQLAPFGSIPAATPQTTQLEQSLLVVTQGQVVNAYSAVTKTWTSMTSTFGPPANTLLNEHLVVRDGPVFYGYSPRSGGFQAKFTSSPSATLVASSSPQTWHSIVLDGAFVHVFFAFTGQWMTFAFSAAPTISTAMNGRFCFLLSDGTNLYAVSDYYGSLVPAPASGASAIGAYGNMAVATSPGLVHGFSAARNTWSSMPVAATPAVTTGNAQPACLAVNDGATVAFFSGHTGAFTPIAAPANAALNLERYVAVAVDGTNVWGYSALLGSVATLTLASAPTVTKQQMFALVGDGTNLHAFSAETGTFAAPIATTGTVLQHKAQVAALTDSLGGGVPVSVYSAHLNEWSAGPGITSGMTYLTAVSVVVEETGGGLWAWSHRGPNWHYLAAPAMDVIVPGTSPPSLAESFAARAGTELYAFNPRTEAWRTMPTAAPATIVRAHHASILAQDGATLYGFSIWDDRWTAQPLLAPYVNGGGQVEAAWATDGVRVYGYGAVGQVGTLTGFPDFYRATTQGSAFRVEVAGEPGAATVLGVALAGAALAAPPFGTLLLDPASLVILAQALIPPLGLFALTLQVPVDPALVGLTPHFQAALVGPSGLYLTNSVFPTIY